MRAVLLIFIAIKLLANDDCHAIFDARKSEILFEIDRLDRKKAELKALEEATTSVMQDKDRALEQKSQDINSTLQKVLEEKEAIKALVAKNEQILKEINESKDSKVVDLYTNMKPSSAGEIMNAMDPYLACQILNQLEADTAAKIISRIEPATAAKITAILQKGPPFVADSNATK